MGVPVTVTVLVNVKVAVLVAVNVAVALGVLVGVVTHAATFINTGSDITGGGESSESMPAVFVMVIPHAVAGFTYPRHETACCPAQVVPTVQLTTLPGFEHPDPPAQSM